MKKKHPKGYVLSYLMERNLPFKEDICEGTHRITTAFSGYPNSPSKCIEACCYFYTDAKAIEVCVFYALPGPSIVEQGKKRLPELFRLLNFINASVFAKNMDGVGNQFYSPSYLLQPRFYLTEDGCNDITATVIFEEDMFWVAPLEILDFITAGLPSLMNQLSLYIYGVLIGNIDVDNAITRIRRNILGGGCDA